MTLRIRSEPVDVPTQEADPASPAPPADAAELPRVPIRTPFANAVDLRFISGSWDELGPVQMWTRLTVPVVEGEEPSPKSRAGWPGYPVAAGGGAQKRPGRCLVAAW